MFYGSRTSAGTAPMPAARMSSTRSSPLSDFQFAVTLALSCHDDIHLNSSEQEFYDMVTEELEQFLLEKNQKKVLLFPPFPNRLRFLTHRVTESYDQLSSFSVGEGLTRRTVVCHIGIRIQDRGAERISFNRDTPRFNNYRKHKGGRGGRDGTSGFSGSHDGSPSFRSSRGRGRSHFNRRPDKDLYVPAAVRQKYESSESDRQVADESELISGRAGKKAICDTLDMKNTLESECNERDMQGQVTEDLEKDSTFAPMDVIPSTLEDKTIVPDVTKPVDEQVSMESNCRFLEITKVVLDNEGNIANTTATVVEAITGLVNSQAKETSSSVLANVTVAAEPVGDDFGTDVGIKVLERREPATEEENNQADFSDQVGKAMSKSLYFAETAGVLSLVDEAVRLEVSSDLDISKNPLQVQHNVVDLTSALTEKTETEVACSILGLEEVISEDTNRVLGKPSAVTELKSEGLNCNEANREGSVGSPNVNLTFKMQALVAVHDKASSVNCTMLIAKSKVESKMVDIQERIYEGAGKEEGDVEPMCTHLATSGTAVCMSDLNDTKLLYPTNTDILQHKDLSEKVNLAGEILENRESCATNNSVETLNFCPQTVQGFVVSDSEFSSLCHKNVQHCVADGDQVLLREDENPKCPTECKNDDVLCENGMNLSALVNEVRGTFEAAEEKKVASCASVNVFSEHGDQENCVEVENIQQLLQEIKVHLSEKDISIGNLKYDYSRYSQPGNVKFSQIIEIYGFLPQINREDLMEAFAEFPESEFKLQWVDSTHALGVFCSEEAVSQALAKTHPFLKFRPLSQGTKQSKLKAYNCLDLPEPYKERPRTDTTVAKRFLNHALGLPQKRKATPEDIPESESVPVETVQSSEPTI